MFSAFRLSKIPWEASEDRSPPMFIAKPAVCTSVSVALCSKAFLTLFAARRAAGEQAKSIALLRKATETDVHAAGFGIKIGGLRPSDASQGLFSIGKRLPFFVERRAFSQKEPVNRKRWSANAA